MFAFLALALGVMGLSFAPLGALLPELFPVPVRYTGAASAYNLGGILGASFAPALAEVLEAHGGVVWVGWYVVAAGLISFLAIMSIGRRVVQETVAQLGELDGQGRVRAGALARRITGREEQYELFEVPPGQRSEPVAVRLDQICLERARRFGDVWRSDRFCEDRLVEGHERAPWPAIAAILVIARLCEPASELHIAEDWYRRTALADFLGAPAERINDDRLYRALDRLLPHKQALETHLKERLGALFDLDYELLLYDVTSTVFRGPSRGQWARPPRLQPRPS